MSFKVLELFAGTRCISKEFEKNGAEVYTVEWDKSFDGISLYADVQYLTVEDVFNLCNGKPNVIWASPDCTTYSLAAISHHRIKVNGVIAAKSEYAMKCYMVNSNLIKLISVINPDYWFIENPRGCLRKMLFMQGLPRYTVTYCQYGDDRMKPTDIWTNHPNPQFKPPCHYGDKCHIATPRGSRTGTQGLKNSKERSKIPVELCKHIVKITMGKYE